MKCLELVLGSLELSHDVCCSSHNEVFHCQDELSGLSHEEGG